MHRSLNLAVVGEVAARIRLPVPPVVGEVAASRTARPGHPDTQQNKEWWRGSCMGALFFSQKN
jgi:hypothetical protein